MLHALRQEYKLWRAGRAESLDEKAHQAHMKPWVERKHWEVNYNIIQFLTEHGDFSVLPEDHQKDRITRVLFMSGSSQ